MTSQFVRFKLAEEQDGVSKQICLPIDSILLIEQSTTRRTELTYKIGGLILTKTLNEYFSDVCNVLIK